MSWESMGPRVQRDQLIMALRSRLKHRCHMPILCKNKREGTYLLMYY